MGFGVWGLGFGVWGLGFWGLLVSGLRLFVFWLVSGFFQGLGFTGFRVWGLGFRVIRSGSPSPPTTRSRHVSMSCIC